MISARAELAVCLSHQAKTTDHRFPIRFVVAPEGPLSATGDMEPSIVICILFGTGEPLTFSRWIRCPILKISGQIVCGHNAAKLVDERNVDR
jgi:hypothetical protein